MITYTFSRREKVLLAVLAIAAVGIAWYMLVFQYATGEINRLNSEISSVQTQQITGSTKVAKKKQMLEAIEQYEEAGVQAREVPEFDNAPLLMAELNNIFGKTRTYTIKFDDPDLLANEDYVLREAKINYGTDTFEEAEAIVGELQNGRYPCRIDEVSIVDRDASTTSASGRTSGTAAFQGTIHATFYEKATPEQIADAKAKKKAEEDKKKAKSTSNTNTSAAAQTAAATASTKK